MVYCIHGGHVGKQCLSSTNVAGGFLPAYVLFSCLQCHAQATVAFSIYTYTNNSPRNISFKFIFGSKKCSVRSAKTHGYTKPLCITYGYIRTKFARRCKQGERQQISCHHHHGVYRMCFLYKIAIVIYSTIAVWVLYQCAKKSFI